MVDFVQEKEVKTPKDFIPFEIAKREGGFIYQCYNDLDDILAEVEEGTEDGLSHLLELQPSDELNFVIRKLAFLGVSIWMYSKPTHKIFSLLDILTNDLIASVNYLPIDEDNFIDFNADKISNLKSLFELLELTETDGKIYNLTERDEGFMRQNFQYLIECMIHTINQHIQVEFRNGNIKLAK